MVKCKRRSLACALGVIAGACALGGFIAPAGMRSASADWSETDEENAVQAPEVEISDENGEIMLLSDNTVELEHHLVDGSGKRSGFTVYTEITAEDHLWPKSDIGHVKVKVKYDEANQQASYSKSENIPIQVRVNMKFVWEEGNTPAVQPYAKLAFNSISCPAKLLLPSDKYIVSYDKKNDKYENTAESAGYLLYYTPSMSSDYDVYYDFAYDVGDCWKFAYRGNQWACNRMEVSIVAYYGRYDSIGNFPVDYKATVYF